MPVYLVRQIFVANPKAEGQSKECLVEAKNKAAAIRYVAEDTITADVCEIADAMRLGAAGVKVEQASGE